MYSVWFDRLGSTVLLVATGLLHPIRTILSVNLGNLLVMWYSVIRSSFPLSLLLMSHCDSFAVTWTSYKHIFKWNSRKHYVHRLLLIKQRNPHSATSRLLLEISPSSNLEGLLFVTGSKIVGMSGIKPLQCCTQTKI